MKEKIGNDFLYNIYCSSMMNYLFAKKLENIVGAVCVEHVYLSVAIPLQLGISSFMGWLKGKSTLMIYDRHLELQGE